MNEREQYWNEWEADIAARRQATTDAFHDILANGYAAIGEEPPARTISFRANRDKALENEV